MTNESIGLQLIADSCDPWYLGRRVGGAQKRAHVERIDVGEDRVGETVGRVDRGALTANIVDPATQTHTQTHTRTHAHGSDQDR